MPAPHRKRILFSPKLNGFKEVTSPRTDLKRLILISNSHVLYAILEPICIL